MLTRRAFLVGSAVGIAILAAGPALARVRRSKAARDAGRGREMSDVTKTDPTGWPSYAEAY